MQNRGKILQKTICIESKLGNRLQNFTDKNSMHLLFMGKDISLISKVTFGRDDENDVVLDGNLVSSFHAEIQKIGNDYFVKDLDSTNGTFVNDILVPKDKYIKLNDNDVIRIGKHEIKMVKSEVIVHKTKSTNF
jgi:hypothetical protein